MAPRHCSTPCFVSPHPDVLAKAKLQALRFQGNADIGEVKRVKKFLTAERKVPGLNDGTIFPKSHFDQPVSIMAMSTAALERTPLRSTIRVIIVLAEFQDVKMAPGTKERMQDLWFSTDRKVPTGSVHEYYTEVSNEAISFAGEVVGPFTLGKDMAYYGNKEFGRGLVPNAQTMASEAVEAAVGSTDFKQYDNDGNGYVDAVVVVHAGRAAEETSNANDIWSVKWVLPEVKGVNGVKIYGFMTVSEDAKCGVCAHEIGHLLFGWPDLYDTDSSSAGVGNWCLMSTGSWGGGGDRPVHPSAWCKAKQGWINTVTETENHDITLEDVKVGLKTHRLWTDGDVNSKEYFLLENRQLSGSDAFLPAGGLLVWHIDDSVYSNSDENHPKIKLMQADGLDELKMNLSRGDAGDIYPGFSHNQTFDSVSTPSSKSYSGKMTHVSATNIPLPSTSMTFNITVRSSAQQDLDPKTWYRLKNTYQPATHCLDVINDAGSNSTGLLQIARDGQYSGQHWQFQPNDDGTYFLRTMFLGADRQLDVLAGDKKTPVLQPKAFVTGQFWLVKPWGDGTWHIENASLGQYLYLDTMDGGAEVRMNTANEGRPTQRWSFSPIGEITEEGF